MTPPIELLGILLSRGAAATGGVLLSFIIARQFGPTILGTFTLFISLLGLLSIIARQGYPTIIIRAVARARARSDLLLPLYYFKYVSRNTLLFSTIIVTVSVPIIFIFGPNKLTTIDFVGLFLSVPMLTYLSIVSGYLKGIEKTYLAPIFDIGGVSLFASIILILFDIVNLNINHSILVPILLTCMSIMCFVASGFIWRYSLQNVISDAPPSAIGRNDVEDISRGRWAFTIISLSAYLSQAGSFALAAPFLSGESLGLLRAAERVALMISFPVLAINPFIAARIARYVHLLQAARARKLVLSGTIAGIGIASPIAAFIFLYPASVLHFLGDEFLAAAKFLRIIAVAHFLMLISGPATMAMSMAGSEKWVMWLSVVTLGILLFGVPVMSYMWGGYGFAVSYLFAALAKALAVIFVLCTRNVFRYIVK